MQDLLVLCAPQTECVSKGRVLKLSDPFPELPCCPSLERGFSYPAGSPFFFFPVCIQLVLVDCSFDVCTVNILPHVKLCEQEHLETSLFHPGPFCPFTSSSSILIGF